MTTVLIVDDSKSARNWTQALMQQELQLAADYLQAASGEEALEVLAGQAVDLLLLDLTMPGLSGYEVLAEMRRRQPAAQAATRVVVISADIQPLAKAEAASLGAVAFLEKPLQLAALRAALVEQGFLHG